METFIEGELDYVLRLAVEANVLSDINAPAGIQTQTCASSVLTRLRKGLTKLEVSGYTAGSIVLHPSDWESVESRAVEHECC